MGIDFELKRCLLFRYFGLVIWFILVYVELISWWFK